MAGPFFISDISIYDKYENQGGVLASERDAALRALRQYNFFKPLAGGQGPYQVRIVMEDNRFNIHVRDADGEDLPALSLLMKPYQRIIHDYFLMIDSYEKARAGATREKLEAIDMARRGLHNEGAELFMSRLGDKIEIDLETARKFFTLLCSLHPGTKVLGA